MEIPPDSRAVPIAQQEYLATSQPPRALISPTSPSAWPTAMGTPDPLPFPHMDPLFLMSADTTTTSDTRQFWDSQLTLPAGLGRPGTDRNAWRYCAGPTSLSCLSYQMGRVLLFPLATICAWGRLIGSRNAYLVFPITGVLSQISAFPRAAQSSPDGAAAADLRDVIPIPHITFARDHGSLVRPLPFCGVRPLLW